MGGWGAGRRSNRCLRRRARSGARKRTRHERPTCCLKFDLEASSLRGPPHVVGGAGRRVGRFASDQESTMTTSEALERYRRNFQAEIDSAVQYRAMADAELDGRTATAYRELAAVEETHASFWEERLRRANATVPARAPSWRARVLALVARRCGEGGVLPTVATREYEARNAYRAQPETKGTGMAAQEWSHARTLRSILMARASGTPGEEVARVEGRHRRVGGNALRAAVLGANDGLCSNLALIMGVAGAAQSERAVLLAGTAGLVAGAFSMAFGERISVTSSRELAEREGGVGREALATQPEEAAPESQTLYPPRTASTHP